MLKGILDKFKKKAPVMPIAGEQYRHVDNDHFDMIDYIIIVQVEEERVWYTKVYKPQYRMENAPDTVSMKRFREFFRKVS